MFGIGKRNALVRELLEQRMRASGFDDMNARLKVKALGTFKLMGVPEGTIVNILETVIREQNRGELLVNIIKGIENKRRRLGGIPRDFNNILQKSIGQNPSEAVFEFCAYRVEVEHYGVMDFDQVTDAVNQAAPVIAEW
jgi:hypothetical protein|tara:strand:- start:150 stop:566 length:417 start_codon:yes stop_codon:yes gene_type:complete